MAPAFSIGAFILTLPAVFIYWWFVEATLNLLKILRFIFVAFFHYLSISTLLKTFFKPWKNEYREGLVRFARFMGMFIKTMFLFFDIFFLLGLVIAEIFVFFLWILFPFLIIWGFYAAIFT